MYLCVYIYMYMYMYMYEYVTYYNKNLWKTKVLADGIWSRRSGN
jgi:hypothetical protein